MTEITFFGILIRTIIGKVIIRWVEAFFKKNPGLNTIYTATKQVVDVVSSGKKQLFTHPVLVEYPSPGIWAIAFNTGKINISFDKEEDTSYTVFIPTTPNPTSGFLAILKGDKIKELNISVEDAMKVILTGGIVKQNFVKTL